MPQLPKTKKASKGTTVEPRQTKGVAVGRATQGGWLGGCAVSGFPWPVGSMCCGLWEGVVHASQVLAQRALQA